MSLPISAVSLRQRWSSAAATQAFVGWTLGWLLLTTWRGKPARKYRPLLVTALLPAPDSRAEPDVAHVATVQGLDVLGNHRVWREAPKVAEV